MKLNNKVNVDSFINRIIIPGIALTINNCILSYHMMLVCSEEVLALPDGLELCHGPRRSGSRME